MRKLNIRPRARARITIIGILVVIIIPALFIASASPILFSRAKESSPNNNTQDIDKLNQILSVNIDDIILVRLLYIFVGSSAFTATLYTLFSRDPRLRSSNVGFLKILLIQCTSIVVMTFCIFIKLLKGIFIIYFNMLFIISISLFIMGWIGIFIIFYLSNLRIFHLKDRPSREQIPGVKYLRRRNRDREIYFESDMIPRHDINSFINLFNFNIKLTRDIKEEISNGFSCLLTGNGQKEMINWTINMLMNCIERDETVNYVTVNKHPFNLFNIIEKHVKYNDLETKLKNNFIIVDSYTPNYGFDDDIHYDNTKRLERKGIQIINGKTITGIHSAISKAHKIFKKYQKRRNPGYRLPNIMIYDSISNLSHISSTEETKIFFNHMIPAEKNYSMITFIIEDIYADEEIMNNIKRLVDVILVFQIGDREPKIEKLIFS